MELEDQAGPMGGKAKGKKKSGAGKQSGKPKGSAGKRSTPVKGDHSIAVAAPDVAGIDQGGGRPAHRREGSIGSSGGTGLPTGAKHSRSTPSPTATRRKGTPSPSTAKGGRSGSSSPRAGQQVCPPAAATVGSSRSPSPGMPTASSPSPPAPDTAMGNDGRRQGKSPTTAVWRGGVAADTSASGVSKRRAPRSHAATTGGARSMVTGGASARKPVTGKSKAPMSKSFDERNISGNMQAIKNAFHAPDGFATRGQSQIPPPAMQSAPSVGDVDEDVSEDFVLDEELCSLHEESIHGEDDDEMEMAEIDALSNGAHSAHSFTSGSALGTGAFLPVGKAHVTSMAGLEEWVAEAAEQKMMPVRLLLKFLLPDFLLSCAHMLCTCVGSRCRRVSSGWMICSQSQSTTRQRTLKRSRSTQI